MVMADLLQVNPEDRQQVQREGYIEEFIQFWSGQSATRRIWISLYTPQIGEVSVVLPKIRTSR